MVEQFVVPIRSGRAWAVLAGQICRIVVVEGAQVADPHGDLSVPVWGEDVGDPVGACHPLGVEVYQPRPGLLARTPGPDSWKVGIRPQQSITVVYTGLTAHENPAASVHKSRSNHQ